LFFAKDVSFTFYTGILFYLKACVEGATVFNPQELWDLGQYQSQFGSNLYLKFYI